MQAEQPTDNDMDTKIPPLIHNSCSLHYIYIHRGDGRGASIREVVVAVARVISGTNGGAVEKHSGVTIMLR